MRMILEDYLPEYETLDGIPFMGSRDNLALLNNIAFFINPNNETFIVNINNHVIGLAAKSFRQGGKFLSHDKSILLICNPQYTYDVNGKNKGMIGISVYRPRK